MATVLTAEEQRVWLAFLRVSHALHLRLAEDMRRIDRISIGWYDVLVNLYHSPNEGLRMQELADQVLMSSSGLTRLLDRMIEEGLVERELCQEDRRVIFAVLTDKGRATIKELLPHHQQRIRDYFIQHLTEAEIQVMGPALERVLAAVTADGEVGEFAGAGCEVAEDGD